MPLRSRLPSCPRWLALLGPVVALLYGGGAVVYLQTRWPTIAVDAAFFQHVGWYVLQGAVPYVDAWDVNPPAPFAITAVLAFLAGGDMLALHGLAVALTTLVSAASVLLVAWVAALVTGEDAAAVAAGVSMFLVPEFVVLPFAGVLAQFYAVFFGVLALGLALRDRPFLAGAVAALSAGSWQAGGVFALLVVGIVARRGGRRAALSAVAGVGVVVGVIVLVFAAAGALVGMVVQTVLAPLVAGEPASLVHRTLEVLLVFGYGAVVIPVAVAGWLAAVGDLRERWWIPAGGVLFALQVLFVDLDGSTDTFLWLPFVALGVAVAVERLLAVGVPATVADRLPTTGPDPAVRADAGADTDPPVGPDRGARNGAVAGRAATDGRGAPDRGRSGSAGRAAARQLVAVVAVVAIVGVLVYAGVVWNQDTPPPKERLQTIERAAEPGEPPLSVTPGDADVPPMRTIYWEEQRPDTCHYRMSWNEARWISRTDDRLDKRTCGGWPGGVDAVPV